MAWWSIHWTPSREVLVRELAWQGQYVVAWWNSGWEGGGGGGKLRLDELLASSTDWIFFSFFLFFFFYLILLTCKRLTKIMTISSVGFSSSKSSFHWQRFRSSYGDWGTFGCKTRPSPTHIQTLLQGAETLATRLPQEPGMIIKQSTLLSLSW